VGCQTDSRLSLHHPGLCHNLPAMKTTAHLFFAAAVCTSVFAQAPPPTPPAPPVNPQIKQAQQLNSEGRHDEALAVLTPMLAANPQNFEANLTAGITLDLTGDYDKARKYLLQAVEFAPADRRVQALRTTAVSYAFTCDLRQVLRYEKLAYDGQMQDQKFTDAAGTANELARIELECGGVSEATKWYKTGYETALRKTDLSEADRDLWDFRWENAQARIAAREGHPKQADAHVAAAKAIIDKGKLPPNQAAFYSYLTGYVAFDAGSYKSAIEELEKADQKDPFILALLAQAYEKSGNKDEAMKLYRQILTINSHSPPNAFARPLAKKKLGPGG
jgi:tetratricopeptide (TPR) repeat protein